MTAAVTARRERAVLSAPRTLTGRIAALDWTSMARELDAHGCVTTGPLLGAEECAALTQTYGADAPFRSRVIMARHGFGRGEYKYFAYPLPEVVAALRGALYPPLADIAPGQTLWLLGLDHERLTFRHTGREFRLTDVSGRIRRDWVG